MISEVYHSLSLGSAFFCVSFILKLAKDYVLQISLSISSEREYLFPDSSSQSPGLVSHEPQLGQAPKPSFVNSDCPGLYQVLIFRERRKEIFCRSVCLNCEIYP